MKYSKLFGRTKKDSKNYASKNATYLLKAGFIDQTMSGVYKFLPLGLRVLNKIENIVGDEMDKISQEMLLTALAPKEIWEQTGREGIDVLMQASGANPASIEQNDSTYILNPTHEDNITPLVKQFALSYKDYPVALYQIQNKFRNEARPKSGLLRGREFRMKDLYSFHLSLEDLMKYYETSKEIYTNVFERLGIGDKTVIALASGGDFTENFSHEFQTFCDAGEDVLFYDEVENIYYNREVAPSKAPEFKYDKDFKQREDVYGENIVGVEELVNFLEIPIEQTIKTMLYETNDGRVIAAGVRGDYEIDEGKLKKITGYKDLKLASEETVKRITGAEIGYAGILDLPKEVELFCDNALEGMVNFEVGANKTHYHTINANWGIDIDKPSKFYDLKVAKEGDINPKSDKAYKTYKSAEVGNIFPLETKFSKAFDLKVLDENGEEKIIYMGSYGIGTTRLMGVIAEISNDENGIIWPESIAPYKVHIVTIANSVDDESYKKSEELYNLLQEKGIDVLWDERMDVRPGEKFADADLIGNPYRIVVSSRSLENGGFELKKRNEKESKIVSKEEILDLL